MPGVKIKRDPDPNKGLARLTFTKNGENDQTPLEKAEQIKGLLENNYKEIDIKCTFHNETEESIGVDVEFPVDEDNDGTVFRLIGHYVSTVENNNSRSKGGRNA